MNVCIWLFYRAGWSYTHGSGFLRGGRGHSQEPWGGGQSREHCEGKVRDAGHSQDHWGGILLSCMGVVVRITGKA